MLLREKGFRFYRMGIILLLCLLIVIIIMVAVFLLRLYDCQLEPELVAKVRLDPTHFPNGNIHESWHAIYESYDGYPGTWIHPHEYYQMHTIDAWPAMDLENYTYIITYCQEIESLSYYMWRENNVPVRTGAKQGSLILKENIEPFTIFIYRIPKMRINNPDF